MSASKVSRSRQNRTQQAFFWGALMGAACGGIIGATVGQGLPFALIFAVYMSLAEGYTDWTRQPGRMKPFLHRLIGTTIFAGAIGVLLSAILPVWLIAILFGILAGFMGLGVRQMIIGIVLGCGVALLSVTIFADLHPAIAVGAINLIYRIILAVVYPHRQVLTISGEHIPPEDARYVVPYEAHTKQIGTDFVKTLAEEISGVYERNRLDIGIVDNMETLRGATFDPALVNPLIREFYEHTSRFKLSIIPEWNPLIKPFYRIFRATIAQPISQANIPLNQEETQLGMVSYIDAVDVAGELPDYVKTIRGWIRAYESTGEAIYVGIYTVVRHDDAGYVSVGFPLPEANWTVTLLPHNQGDNFLLKTENLTTPFSGHYLSDIDNDTGALTIVKLPMMQEEIDVFIKDGELKTDHRFYFGELLFLTLHYHIERKESGSA